MESERPLGVRQWLGLVVLVFTIGPAYLATRAPVAHDAATAVEVVDASVVVEATIKQAATRYGVREDLIAAVIEAESEFNPRAVSPRGAQGLMQLMPSTAARLGVRDPFDPRENITGGVRHLRSLMDRFDNDLPLALAAYNAGERAVLAHGGVPPYPETRAYVRRILRRLDGEGSRPPGRRASRPA